MVYVLFATSSQVSLLYWLDNTENAWEAIHCLGLLTVWTVVVDLGGQSDDDDCRPSAEDQLFPYCIVPEEEGVIADMCM